VYLQCKHGFVEADLWDGTWTTSRAHDEELRRVRRRSKRVIVVRSRSVHTLENLVWGIRRDPEVFESAPGWDYAFRVYLTDKEWGKVLTDVALHLDYRNFKKWTIENSRGQAELAHDVWHAAHDNGGNL